MSDNLARAALAKVELEIALKEYNCGLIASGEFLARVAVIAVAHTERVTFI